MLAWHSNALPLWRSIQDSPQRSIAAPYETPVRSARSSSAIRSRCATAAMAGVCSIALASHSS